MSKIIVLCCRSGFPFGERCPLWVAAHAVEFYNDLDSIRRLCKEFKQEPTWNSFSPGQGYPPGVAYVLHKENGENNNRNALTRDLSDGVGPAPAYVEKVMDWIAVQLEDEAKIPDLDNPSEFRVLIL